MSAKVKCSCGHSWNTSDSSKKDASVCHICGKDNTMEDGGWLDQYKPGGKVPKPRGYIDITKQYGIPQFTEEYINKAMELNKQYPGSKFVCTANGCADIASQAANAMGHNFGKANAWEYGNRSDVLFTNPNYAKELENPTGPLHDPTSYNVPNQFLGMENVLVGLNRKNNLLDVQGNKVGNIPNAQQVGAAKTRAEANDSIDYANQNLYRGSRGYEHIGYMMGNNTLLHGTGASKDHPAFFVLDDISNGIDLSGYGQYEPVEAIAEPTKLQTFTNKVRSLGTRAGEMIFGEPGSKQASSNIIKKENGGWLDKYEPGGTVAKTDATRVAAPALKLTKTQLEKNKAINKQVMVNTEKANAKKLAERKKGMAESSEADIINPNDKRFAIGDKFRMFPNDIGGVGEVFDDFINPAVFVGDTASGLGNAMIDRDPAALAIETGMALGTGALGFDPLGGVMKAIPNTYKINPFAFKPQEGMMYRGLGEAGAKDAIESGVFRPLQHNYPEKRTFTEIVNSPKQFGSTYYAPAKNFNVVDNYGSGFVAEVPYEGNNFGKRYGRKDWSYMTSKQIPVNEGRILQKDWLQGYKPIKEDGGLLEKYNDGGPVQPNYNDYSVSAGPGFEGDGYSNVGRNYSPAWGGQFEDGGNLSFIKDPKLRNMLEGYQSGLMQPGDYRLPEGRMAGNIDPSTEVSISIGGEDGEPSYLIPSFKYGSPLQDPTQEFNMTGQYLGGPFKTWQDAEAYGELRHQYIDKGYKELPSPIATSNMAMGGSLPGATGFMYARVGAPSNGKYAKKTKASAKNGSVIKDDMGQYNHPGEITEIGSNQITMQGVPYPVLGISDTGDTQMMYPNQEYEFIGESVTEYPIMQDGGMLDSIINLGKRAVNYIGGLFDDDNNVNVNKDDLIGYAPTLKTSRAKNEYDKFADIYYHSPQRKKVDRVSMPAMYDDVNIPDYSKDENRIKLGTGRFSGANVSSKLIDDIAAAAKRNNIPVGQLLTLAGRESTFGQEKGKNINSGNPRAYTSGWNIDEKYQPYEPKRFLADKKVPGINVIKSPNGYQYEVTNQKAIVEHLKKNPQLINEYKKKIESTPDIGNRNSFDLSAEFLKEKGVQGYNPRDPKYVEMFNKDYDTLKQDKALMSYLKKKGYTYEQGGQLTKLDQLTNFTNYNTKQPGGWLDKYQ